jgi:hypothetical protein
MDLIGELTLGNETAGSNRSESAVIGRNFGFNSAVPPKLSSEEFQRRKAAR